MSLDGKLSTRERKQVKISGKEDFERVDKLKAKSDAIMVGIGTVLADDPSLTIKSDELKHKRLEKGLEENPVRVVVDSAARIPLTSSLLYKGKGRRVIAVSRRADPQKVIELKKIVTVIEGGETEVDLARLLDELGAMGVHQLMVEGGGTLISGLFAARLVDEIYTFIGNLIIGGKDAPTLADGEGFVRENDFSRLTLLEATQLGKGILLHWKVSPQ
jgi:2,5-diamino-6-(ribosylamino)-4(3H)-pyrimidinone 5'-phosphate reductase